MEPIIVALNAVEPAGLVARAGHLSADVNNFLSFARAIWSILGPKSHLKEGVVLSLWKHC